MRGGKSDARDALAICEAARRPGLHPVPIKSIEQQDIQLLHRLRQRQVQHSTALANQIRSLDREYGVIFPAGIRSLILKLPEALEDGSNELSPVARYALADQHQCLIEVRKAMVSFHQQIMQLAEQHPAYVNLLALPGIGPLVASAFGSGPVRLLGASGARGGSGAPRLLFAQGPVTFGISRQGRLFLDIVGSYQGAGLTDAGGALTVSDDGDAAVAALRGGRMEIWISGTDAYVPAVCDGAVDLDLVVWKEGARE